MSNKMCNYPYPSDLSDFERRRRVQSRRGAADRHAREANVPFRLCKPYARLEGKVHDLWAKALAIEDRKADAW